MSAIPQANLRLSNKGAAFNAGHEGFVSRTYRCPAGVLTIGFGFTWGSRVFREYWLKTRGHRLRMGDTITREEALKLMQLLFDEEYGRAVNQRIGTSVQHQFDGAGSVTYNCGPGALAWKWALHLRAREIRQSAERLRETAVTANGRRLAGLVRRRAEEAQLIQHGDYGNLRVGAVPSRSQTEDEVKEFQKQLQTLGYYAGDVDGKHGPLTDGAIRNIQRDKDLVVDGIVGPATRAALIRALDAKRGAQATGGAAAGGGAAGGGTEITDAATPAADVLWSALGWGLAAVAVVVVAVLILKWRGVITGRRVPT